MSFAINRRSPLRYDTQVQRQAIAQLIAGRLHTGDKLPSVRQFARDLRVSRGTAERIQDALCEAMVAEIRPRSGAYVAWPHAIENRKQAERPRVIYAFVKEMVNRARRLGLDSSDVVRLISAVEEGLAPESIQRPVCFPVVATREGFECIVRCFDDAFPARFVHVPEGTRTVDVPAAVRYVLSTCYMRERAVKIAAEWRCSVLCVRYNVKLLNESMTIPGGEHRQFLTRDADNAETIRLFLASAYPEVPASRYTVSTVDEWLSGAAQDLGGSIWASVTAAPSLEGRADRRRLRLRHPLLAPDFVDELRCLALFG